MTKFNINSPYQPSGDQPKAIKKITQGIVNNDKSQIMLGVTGSGKTFTMASIINEINKPSMIIAHNKTLAAQIYSEMKALFPDNAVEYFISYYDYYQPEAYIPRTDTYIEKDSSINEQIDMMRHSATRSLLERRDVIVVASVSCIYGLGSPETYSEMRFKISKEKNYKRKDLLQVFIDLQYSRNDLLLERGNFRVCGENIEIMPSHYENIAWRLMFFGDELENIYEFDPLTGKKYQELESITLYANSHFIATPTLLKYAIENISIELEDRIEYFKSIGKNLEAERIKQRTNYDIETLETTGACKGIENYSRFFNGREEGEAPPTLFEYFPKDGILFVDESHVTIPQIKAMYNGDKARKTSLVEHGFRLPSALDNRPLKFEEWLSLRPQTIFVSATPGEFETEISENNITELIIRPTGLIDPECIILPVKNQVDDLIHQINDTLKKKLRVLVTTLTKKMAEDLTEYLKDLNYKVEYLHSSVHTLDRINTITELREGKIEIIVGVNLLREGLDIPECGLVAIMDADKEGFLRSTTSLIQTIGRAARNSESKVILYADIITKSIKNALNETERRRTIQKEFNKANNITPKTVKSAIKHETAFIQVSREKNLSKNNISKTEIAQLENDIKAIITKPTKVKQYIDRIHNKMIKAATDLDFETAAKLRDQINIAKNIAMQADNL